MVAALLRGRRGKWWHRYEGHTDACYTRMSRQQQQHHHQVGRRADSNPGWPDPAPDRIEGFVTATFDLDDIALTRAAWGIYRDRRPDLYGAIATLDGVSSR